LRKIINIITQIDSAKLHQKFHSYEMEIKYLHSSAESSPSPLTQSTKEYGKSGCYNYIKNYLQGDD